MEAGAEAGLRVQGRVIKHPVHEIADRVPDVSSRRHTERAHDLAPIQRQVSPPQNRALVGENRVEVGAQRHEGFPALRLPDLNDVIHHLDRGAGEEMAQPGARQRTRAVDRVASGAARHVRDTTLAKSKRAEGHLRVGAREPRRESNLQAAGQAIDPGPHRRFTRERGQRRLDPSTVDTYESGVVSVGTSQVKMSVEFYLVAIFFVIFDLETVFIFAWAVVFFELGWTGYVAILAFIVVFGVALIYEWRTGALEWGRKVRVGLPITDELV